MVKIGAKKSNAEFFVTDFCHKIYLIESEHEGADALANGYEKLIPIEQLKEVWDSTCDLRFIYNWTLDKTFAKQFAKNVKISVV